MLWSTQLATGDPNSDQSLRAHIGRIRAEIAAKGLSGPSEFEYVRVSLSQLDNDLREPCEFLYFQGHSIGIGRIEAKYTVLAQKEQREKRYFWTSLAMLLVVLAISLFIPGPSVFQITVLRLIMALAAAAFVAFLPGMLTIQGTLPPSNFLNKGAVKASGAGAVFLLVYYYAPKIIQ